jgi:hypothetical protein
MGEGFREEEESNQREPGDRVDLDSVIGLILALCLTSGYCEEGMVDVLREMVEEVEISHGVEGWRGLVEDHFPAEAVDRMICLMGYESGGDPRASSPTDDHGLLQIHWPVWGGTFGVTREELYEPGLNVRLAREIWNRQGFGAWSPWNRGLCR